MTYYGTVTWTTANYVPHQWNCEHRHTWQDKAAQCAAGKVRQLTRYGRNGSTGVPVVLHLVMNTGTHA